MNEVSNDLDGSVNGCPNSSLENPPYKPGSRSFVCTVCVFVLCMCVCMYICMCYYWLCIALDGDHLQTRTLCMTAENTISTQYNVHSLYGYSEARSTMKYYAMALSATWLYCLCCSALRMVLDKRSMVISRSTYPNSGMYGGHWLGDNESTWPDLYLSIPGLCPC